MIVYAIRHKPTREWMPVRMYRASLGGWSYWTPGDASNPPHDKNMRLFYTLKGAQNALSAWLQGHWHREQGSSDTYDGRDDWDIMRVTAPETARVREDMEIVPFTLFEGQARA